MEKDPQEKIKEENDGIKKGFFKKVWYSIDKIEKYSELSAEGFGKAMRYLCILVMILSIISSVVSTYKTSIEMKNVAQYINDKLPDITYKDGVLQASSTEPITDENTGYGKMIIDTVTDSEEQINQYINQIGDEENGIIILKNKLILKEVGIQSTANYDYKQLAGEIGITEFNKQQLVEYLTSSKMMSVYMNLTLSIFV